MITRIHWTADEDYAVALACARQAASELGAPRSKYTVKHFLQAQTVLPADRHCKKFNASKVARLRVAITAIEKGHPREPGDLYESTAAVHSGAYDSVVRAPGAPSNVKFIPARRVLRNASGAPLGVVESAPRATRQPIRPKLAAVAEAIAGPPPPQTTGNYWRGYRDALDAVCAAVFAE